MATEESPPSREQADAQLRAHRLSEQAALAALMCPPDSSSPDDTLTHARQHAHDHGGGALDTIRWLERLVGGFLVQNPSFAKARAIAPYASPQAQAAWLSQWQRPQIWLAALGDRRTPDTFPALLEAVLGLSPPPRTEAVAALLWRALTAADDCVWELQRAGADAEAWNQRTWPNWAARLSDTLVHGGGELGEVLAEEALVVGSGERGPPRDPAVAQIWCVELGKRISDAMFIRLLQRAMEPKLLAESALKAAALSALARIEADSGWARRVIGTYLAMPIETWRGCLPPPGRSEELGTIAGLLGACLDAEPQSQAWWSDSWHARNPGAPEGWPRDLTDWDDRADAAAHLELVGILATIHVGCEPEASPTIKNPELFRSVQANVHERLNLAAGSSGERDSYVIQALWAAGGDEAIRASCEAVRDGWVLERAQEFERGSVRFGRF